VGIKIDLKSPNVQMISDPIESAKAAGLRYVSDESPGIRRKQKGKHFAFLGLDGKLLKNEAEIGRIRALAIPPAYTDVWICPDVNGHLQATGRDARGRKQYRYHKRWREIRDETKYGRMIAFAETLTKIRDRVNKDFSAKDFRTWVGTVTCALMLAAQDPMDSVAAAKKSVNEVVKNVAARLGNTPSVCRKCYIHPSIIENYMEGGALERLPEAVVEDLKTPATRLRPEEKAVLAILKKRLRESDSDRTTKLLRKSLHNRKAKAH